MNIDDTIVAIATPIGEGGISVVRVSGRAALDVAQKIFQPVSGTLVADMPTHTAHYGYVCDPATDEAIDDGVLTVFRGPKSYTGEDTAEISCHGGLVPTRMVLGAALRAGARLAEPGEFTKCAFLNGRIDLAQAEAVQDIIRARTDEALRVARRQLDGVLSTRIRMLREEMIGIMAQIEAAIDFPEDVADLQPTYIAASIRDAVAHVSGLLSTADKGKIFREGIQAVIAGQTNVGKSSLMNALLRESRAIVTAVPGTTRDIIEESLNIRGIPVRTIDTAGVRETDDVVEKIGVDKAREMIDTADIVLVVLDAARGFEPDDEAILRGLGGRKVIVILNKSDLVRESDLVELEGRIRYWLKENLSAELTIVKTSAPMNEGILELEAAIADMVLAGGISTDGALVSNARHRHSLEEALSALEQALGTAESGTPLDFISIDLRSAVDALGSITGETVAEDVIDRIFSEFCIGK